MSPVTLSLGLLGGQTPPTAIGLAPLSEVQDIPLWTCCDHSTCLVTLTPVLQPPQAGLLILTSTALLVFLQQVKHLKPSYLIFQTHQFYLRSLSEVLWRVHYHRPPPCFPHGLHSIPGVMGCRLDPTSMTHNLLASPAALLPSPYSSHMGPKSIPGPGYKMKLRPKYW